MGLALTGTPGISGIVPGAIAVAPPEPVAPEWLEFEVTTTAPNQTYSWQIAAGTGISATTQWGDGTTQTHTAAGIFTKTYASAGVYTVRIQASWATSGTFNLRPNADRTRLTRLLSPIPGFAGLTNLLNFLNGCTGLTGSIPTDFLRYVVNVTNFSALFSGCTGLTGSIPTDFLRYVVNATNLSNFLSGCSGLTGSTPADFLRYVVNATNLSSLLQNCTRLQLTPDILGPDPNRFLDRSVSFSNAFRSVGTFSGTPQGTAPEIWLYNFGVGIPTTSNAFFGNSSSLSNWAQIPAAWGGPA